MSKKGFNRPWLSLTMGLLVVLTATISAATISVGSAGYLGLFIDLPRQWSFMLVVLSMGLVASLSTRQSVAVAGIMTSPAQVFVCPGWVSVTGLVSSIGLLSPDLVVR